MNALYLLLDLILILLMWLIISQISLTLLIQLNIINARHAIVRSLENFLSRVLSPMLYPIHQWLTRLFPSLIGINLAPVVLLLLLYFFRNLLTEYWPSL